MTTITPETDQYSAAYEIFEGMSDAELVEAHGRKMAQRAALMEDPERDERFWMVNEALRNILHDRGILSKSAPDGFALEPMGAGYALAAFKWEVGMGATQYAWSDSYAGTVVAVTPTTITIREDKTESIGPKMEFVPGGFAGHCVNQGEQRWRYIPDPNGRIIKATLRKNGAWRAVGSRNSALVVPGRRKFHDYNF